MSKRRAHLYSDNESRQAHLNTLIKEIFGHLDTDEIEISASGHSTFETRMFEVVRIRPQSGVLMDLYEDLEFKPVLFPKELTPFLRRHDVFLGTLGFKDSAWTVLHLSPCYSSDRFQNE